MTQTSCYLSEAIAIENSQNPYRSNAFTLARIAVKRTFKSSYKLAKTTKMFEILLGMKVCSRFAQSFILFFIYLERSKSTFYHTNINFSAVVFDTHCPEES